MDAKAAKKALYRAKLKDSQREKRIDSPLVRYNEIDQPVCRVCDVILKSEALWAAHQASRKHHEAIKNVRATAAGLTKTNDAKSAPPIEYTDKPLPRSSSILPTDFFGKHDVKKQKVGTVGKKESSNVSGSRLESFDSENRKNESPHSRVVDAKEGSEIKLSFQPGHTMRKLSGPEIKPMKGALPESFFDTKDAESTILADNSEMKLLKRAHPESFSENKDSKKTKQNSGSETKQSKGALPEGFFDNSHNTHSSTTEKMNDSDVKQVKGALPEGFFDNKDADLRARGIEPVKVDIKDEYKEFEKLIQEDLHVVDERFEEEEIDAADIREGEESLEQNTYKERVEMLKNQQMEFKKKQMELKAARYDGKKGAAMQKDSGDEESSSDEDDNEESFAVDWRAKRF